MDQHQTLVNAIMRYDARESTKKSYNRYALSQYLKSLEAVERWIEAGKGIRQSILTNFNGKLADALLKAVNEQPQTLDEKRGW